ncbi:MAG: hypothetical protein ACOVNR_05660, partial [Chitinophagaceae bacterium]
QSLFPLLQKQKATIPVFSWHREQLHLAGDSFFNAFPQNLVKVNNEVFVFLNGSGRLYKAITNNNGVTNFQRIDSTSYFGYNIGAYCFSYQKKIYNFGGYGYWRLNGQLRVFNQQAKQWDIVKLNKEYPNIAGADEGLIWLDSENGKLYVAYYTTRDEAVKNPALNERTFHFTTLALDLNSFDWQILGKTNSILKDKLAQIKPIANTPWGQLIAIGDKISLLNFQQNTILQLKESKDFYQSIVRSQYEGLFFCVDSTLFWGSYSKNNFNAVKLSINDFNNTQTFLFKEPMLQKIKRYAWLFWALLGIVWVLVGFIFRNKILAFVYGKKKLAEPQQSVNNGTSTQAFSPFSNIEKNILKLFLLHATEGKLTSTAELNNIMGITDKPTDQQKKIRSDYIIDINKKYRLLSGNTASLINKSRMETDKRSFEYFIDQSQMNTLQSLL